MSNATQLQGDSLRRQLQAFQDYAGGHRLTIDKSLRLEDIGKAPWTNIQRGALGHSLLR
jgi:hypothetical protein